MDTACSSRRSAAADWARSSGRRRTAAGAAERLTDSPYVRASLGGPGGRQRCPLHGERGPSCCSRWITTDSVRPLLQTPQPEQNGEISPDGRWLAYAAPYGRGAGFAHLRVGHFRMRPRARPRCPRAAAREPLWARNGRELFYLAPDGTLMSVSVTPGTAWNRSPTKVIQKPYSARSSVPARGPMTCRRTINAS